jgi:hypothetical protein
MANEPDFYVATSPLFVGTALAHNVGDLVPAENVKANDWHDGVARPGTKAAEVAEEPAPK